MSASGGTGTTGPGVASVRVAFESARLQLAEIREGGAGAKRTGYEIACRLSATTLDVERVSVWRLVDGDARIVCVAAYARANQRDGGLAPEARELTRAACPAYFEALLGRRVVAADDARTDPKTTELSEYLGSIGVGALLDAPIYRDGNVIGVVCHEHVGGPRRWTSSEAEFASAVADMLTLLVEQAERAELRAALEAERHAQARAHKMEALQRLARVAAHDLNNVLAVALARNKLMARGQDVETQSYEMSEVLSYGARLVQQLGDFCDERAGTGTVNLVELLYALEPSLRALVGRASFDLEIAPEAASASSGAIVDVPSVEAEQLILNLCMNARDAIEDDGHIVVSYARDAASRTCVLCVSDDGVGMDDATQERMFEPYFSTKASHSGVGLMAVYGVVKRAGGAISLESAPGRGTRFRISLPLVHRAATTNT